MDFGLLDLDPIISELLNNSIPITLVKKEGKIVVEVPGFYKSNHITLSYNKKEKHWVAIDRYKEETIIYEFHDLLNLNHSWWQRSKDSWNVPDDLWKDLLIRRGYVKTKQITIYE